MSETNVFSPKINLIHCQEQKDGSALFSFYISNHCDEDLDPVMEAWLERNDEIAIEHPFKIPEIIDDMIEFRRYSTIEDKVVMGEESRPLMDDIRAQLMAALAKMDAIQFAND